MYFLKRIYAAFLFFKTMNKQTNTAQAYREHIAAKIETIDITAPSGFVFKFRKPNFFGIALTTLFRLKPDEIEQAVAGKPAGDMSEKETLQTMFEIRDRVLEHSHTPKIVIGRAKDASELSTADIADNDLLYLFKWFAAGGSAEVMKSMFAKVGK